MKHRIQQLRTLCKRFLKSVFKADNEAVKFLFHLRRKYVVVLADKISNNIVFYANRNNTSVLFKHRIKLLKELYIE